MLKNHILVHHGFIAWVFCLSRYKNRDIKIKNIHPLHPFGITCKIKESPIVRCYPSEVLADLYPNDISQEIL